MNPNAAPFHPKFNYEQPMQQQQMHDYPMQQNYPIYQMEQPMMNQLAMGQLGMGGQPVMGQSIVPPSGLNQGQTGQASHMLSAELLEKMYAHSNGAALFEIQIGLEQMVYESHEYDTWACAIRDRLTSSDIRNEELCLAADIIIEMAISVSNCQYNFSKLCQFLNGFIRSFALGCLIPQLNEFVFQHSSQYGYLLTGQQLQNLVLFLAELYDKVEVNGMRLSQISALIFDQIHNLLKSDVQDSSVKATIQALKLVGRYLEADQGPTPLDGIFATLNELCFNSKDLSENVRGQVLALNQLRQNKWGVSEQSTSTTTANLAPLVPTHYTNGTNGGAAAAAAAAASSSSVFIIGPDGKPLSEEEYAFLEESCAPFASSNSPCNSYAEALEEDEVLEDYEKFLQATAIRAAEKALEKLSFEEDDVESVLSAGSGDASAHAIATSTPNYQHQRLPQYNQQNGFGGGGPLTIVRKEKRNGSTTSAASSSTGQQQQQRQPGSAAAGNNDTTTTSGANGDASN